MNAKQILVYYADELNDVLCIVVAMNDVFQQASLNMVNCKKN